MSKAIVLFSDGTGNSAAALHETNVWRLYQALDLSPPQPGSRRQVAYYDDGVGTSTFKPIALLGGIFGYGLKRNVLDIYTFLCRNYEPGDQIYAFGFSRGAFTIRVLVGFVVRQGLVQCDGEAALRKHAEDAYRRYRRRYNSKGGRRLVKTLRKARDCVIRNWRKWHGQRQYEAVPRLRVDRIAFVGVWDTVAAYGLPIAELTRAIDNWVWPLSMPDYKLSKLVLQARHALSLDDERDTFHPLLWDEVAEADMIGNRDVEPDRLQQVWFAGVHSNLGGGYPDDTLSYVSLEWMLDEATKAGLRFRKRAVAEIRRTANPYGPIYNSRRGLAAYYRYQPRKISARVDPPDATTKVMQDPDLKGAGLLTDVKIHESVFDRIRSGDDGYAPIVLPGAYRIVGSNGVVQPPLEAHPKLRAEEQEKVWNIVWKRRVTYFSTVAVSLLLACMPIIQGFRPPSACAGLACVISPILLDIRDFLPGFLSPWLNAFARAPGWFLTGVAAIILLLMTSTSLQSTIQDRMRDLWNGSLGLTRLGRRPQPVRGGFPADRIYRMRTNARYQGFWQRLKWNVAPDFFGILTLTTGALGGLALAFLLFASPVHRTQLWSAERTNRYCAAPEAQAASFSPNMLCWSTRQEVKEGVRYQVLFHVAKGWFDESIPASPAGFGSERMPWYLHYGSIPLRRFPSAKWLQPMAKIIPTHNRGGPVEALDVVCDLEGKTCSAEFTARADGVLHLFVNDAIITWHGLTDRFYRNNDGSAEVTVTALQRQSDPSGARN